MIIFDQIKSKSDVERKKEERKKEEEEEKEWVWALASFQKSELHPDLKWMSFGQNQNRWRFCFLLF